MSSKKTFPFPDSGQEQGTSLVEAMVSVAILAIAVLGMGLVLTSSWHTITATEQDVNQEQFGMIAAADPNSVLPVAQTLSMAVNVPNGGGGNPLVTVANPVSLIPVDNLLTLTTAGTGITASPVSVPYGVYRNSINQWWIP